jgi:hypothetical protein
MFVETKLKIMKAIKIGRKTYDIKKGDYILFNRACYQFCTGDGRGLKFENWSSYSSLVIPKIRLKEIPFDSLNKIETGTEEDRTLMIKWIF